MCVSTGSETSFRRQLSLLGRGRRATPSGNGHFLSHPAQNLNMRMTLDLDDRLLGSLAARHPGVPGSEAVDQAVRAYLEADSAERLRALAGSFPIEDVSTELRADDRIS